MSDEKDQKNTRKKLLEAAAKDCLQNNKKVFLSGAINRISHGKHPPIPLQQKFFDESLSLAIKLGEKFLKPSNFDTPIGNKKFLEHNEDYRQGFVTISLNMAEKYSYGSCTEMTRIGIDYLRKKYGGSLSIAHAQLYNPKDLTDIYHEVILLGINAQQLQQFSLNKFADCGDGLILDPWEDKFLPITQLKEHLKRVSTEQQNGIFKGIDLSRPENYKIFVCIHYPSSNEKKLTAKASTVEGEQPLTDFFKEPRITTPKEKKQRKIPCEQLSCLIL